MNTKIILGGFVWLQHTLSQPGETTHIRNKARQFKTPPVIQER
jgi:hypothetical protein